MGSASLSHPCYACWGYYLETYEKADGRWRIKTMKLSYLRIERSLGVAPHVAGVANTGHLRGANPANGAAG